jgi:hypothetical protein
VPAGHSANQRPRGETDRGAFPDRGVGRSETWSATDLNSKAVKCRRSSPDEASAISGGAMIFQASTVATI